jgi:hypothetical protein
MTRLRDACFLVVLFVYVVLGVGGLGLGVVGLVYGGAGSIVFLNNVFDGYGGLAVAVIVFGAPAAGGIIVFVTGGERPAVNYHHIRERGRGVGVRRTRSSGVSTRVGRPRVSFSGGMRRLLQAGTSVDRLVDYLLDRAVDKLPVAAGARFAEEWRDHRQHYRGWRLLWWALCVRATAMRTVAELGPARRAREG